MPASAYRVTDLRDLDAAFTIRETVFVAGQGVPATLENDEHDRRDARHYLARAPDGTPAGAARWRETENGVKLERFAVLENFRNQKIGATLLHAVLADVRAELPDKEVYLNAQLRAVPFYERHGFQTEGEMFEEANIQHYRMVLR
ncbi:GNAT family N-acetyltransferase [Hymenobacter sp. PAMC 26628]|uniref:GNAT family N-acetyltransferase n=1 Tax=Hymenobacter sp. PAMC 26628 TaxID=1484118 RepID=UPI00076FECAC|nr:GNAT family N-acetyltransferase [Hymenobacter sp. PAMC 26628]AMJ65067.1 GNAT family acetyltransferase [Hymenobacter sp. PAMC 26628]